MKDKSVNSIDAWEENADFWDNRMGEGNDFHRVLIAPTAEKLLNIQKNQQVLDICCGNGQFSRRLHHLGAQVTALDGCQKLINIAKRKSNPEITYQVIDVTHKEALLTLKNHHFDAAICNMALMDIPDIVPLFQALRTLLKNKAVFVFCISHPCFNRPGMGWFQETIEHQGTFLFKKGIKITDYISLSSTRGEAMQGQPVPHHYWNRPLSYYFQTALTQGYAIEGLEEPTFPTGETLTTGWADYPEIPPVLGVKLRIKSK